ncbi:MAG: hydroxymethylpyrimidine/phosphomethylpyrimidine kinase [Bacteroides sp.]|nr:hydroxymethylpyrimidine/phosphomethylpyrimidine kinase [Bacteroides sp.]
MKRYPTVFSMGASDCVGSAGVQADIKTVSSLGAYACAATTSVVVQNTEGGIENLHLVPTDFIKKQIKVVMEDIRPDVVKIGFVNDVNIIKTIAEGLRKYHPRFVVFDPVIFTVEGIRMLEKDAIKAIQDELFHFTNLITMTLEEAEILTNIKVSTMEKMRETAQNLAQMSNMTILLRGHCPENNHRYHILRLPNDEEWIYDLEDLSFPHIHGIGSTFSAAVAAFIALGKTFKEAIEEAQEYIINVIISGKNIRIGHSGNSLCHTFNPKKMVVIDSTF